MRLLQNHVILVFSILISLSISNRAFASESHIPPGDSISTRIIAAEKINPTTIQLVFADKHRMTIDFYGENIFRVFEDTSGGIIRRPAANPPAEILVNNPRKSVSTLTLDSAADEITIASSKIAVLIDRKTSLFKVENKLTGKVVLAMQNPIKFEAGKVKLVLKENPDEYFFGGGVQNGRFSHKGKSISIVNENSWTDGGVASPNPFCWSTAGYGVMWYTFKPGKYDFGAEKP
jgi:hypothetical protein